MTTTFKRLRRLLLLGALLPLLVGMMLPASAAAATKLFVVANELGQIWRVDPVTGEKISSFALSPATFPTRPGLAFDGTYLYYTDELLNYVQIYTETGTAVNQLQKPAIGNELGSGLAATKTSLFLVSLDGRVVEIDSTTGAVLNSVIVAGASHGLAFAGSLNQILVVVNDTTIKKLTLAGADAGTIVVGDIFRGLGFSSSSSTIYGVRQGFLWAADPVTGNTLPGYPVQMHDSNLNLILAKSGGAAADEPVLEECGDEVVNANGETCDPPGSTLNNGQDCTYCGDGELDTPEQCDDGNTVNTDDCRNDCTLPRCGDGILDPGEGCDDGNLANGDGCSATCTVEPFCGDGIVQPALGEQCDPPNVPGCDTNCHATEICTDLIDNDGDQQIDCTDDDCDCLPIGRDPGAIRFGPPTGHDLFAVHGALDPESGLDPTTDTISFLLTKNDGTVKIFQLVIPAGEVKRIGRNLFRYKNNLAKRQRSGLARFDLRYCPKRDNFTFVVKAYGDLSGATEANMAVQLVIGEDKFLNESAWAKLPKGWKLSLPGE